MIPVTTTAAELTSVSAPAAGSVPAGETHLAAEEAFTEALASVAEADQESPESAIELAVPEGDADESGPTGLFEDVEVRVEARVEVGSGVPVTVEVDGVPFPAEADVTPFLGDADVTPAETPAAAAPDPDEGVSAEEPSPKAGRAIEPDLDQSVLARRALAEAPNAQSVLTAEMAGDSGDAPVELRPVREASAPQVGPPPSNDLPAAETTPTIHAEPDLGRGEPAPGPTRADANTGQATEGGTTATRASVTVPDQPAQREILAGHTPPVDQRPTPAGADGPEGLSEESSRPSDGLPRPFSTGPASEDGPAREAMFAALRAKIGQLESQQGPESTRVRETLTPNNGNITTEPVQLAQILKGVLLDQSLALTGPKVAARAASKGQTTPPALLGVEAAVDGESTAAPLPVFGAESTGDGEAPWQNQLRGEAIFEPRSVQLDVARYEQIIRLTDGLAAGGWTPAGGAASAMRAAGVSAIPLSNLEAHELPEQLVRAIRLQWRQGVGEARMRLNPPNLGEVQVALQVHQGVVSAVLASNSEAVREWIRSQQHELKAQLAAHGLELEQLIVEDDRPSDRQSGQHFEHARRRAPRRTEPMARFEVRV